MSKNQIYIFTMDTCVHCNSLKKRLSDIDINYTEIEISFNRELWESVVKQTQSNYVPTIFVKSPKSDNGSIYVPGKDYKDEDEIVEILKSMM